MVIHTKFSEVELVSYSLQHFHYHGHLTNKLLKDKKMNIKEKVKNIFLPTTHDEQLSTVLS